MKNRLKFLLIDDNEIDGLIATKLLEINLPGAHVQYTDGCENGLAWIKSNHKSDDETLIILLDIRMPGMDGFDFLKLIDELEEPFKKNIGIFMLSSTLNPHEYEMAEKNKYVIKLLSKPLPVQELLYYIASE